ncbi:ACP S-malonyltransferase [Eubacteriales bacterium KG127]
MKIGILFAGQGSQYIGMGRDFYSYSEEFKKIIDLLPEDQKNMAFRGPLDELSRTYNTQPIMLAFGIGVYKILEKEGINPDFAAGLSLGEYTALAGAGILSPEDALELIQIRADAMEKASENIEPAMCAVLGLEEEKVRECCAEASTTKEFAEIANLNCPGQIVISGNKEAVEKAKSLALSAGASRGILLNVSGPFHTSYMKSAGEIIRKKVLDYRKNLPKFQVLFNSIGDLPPEDYCLEDLLEKQVSTTVKMESIIRKMIDYGVDFFIEVGPGKNLSGFVRKIDRKIDVMSISEIKDLETLKEKLKNKK